MFLAEEDMERGRKKRTSEAINTSIWQAQKTVKKIGIVWLSR